MSWTSEFGSGYDVPVEAIEGAGLRDESWHNDACPSFGGGDMTDPATGDLHDLRLWVEHPDPDMRESGGTRFAVNYHPWASDPVDGVPDVSMTGQEIYAGDDLDAALRAFGEARSRILAAIATRAGA